MMMMMILLIAIMMALEISKRYTYLRLECGGP